MNKVTVNNPDCLGWKFPDVQGISTRGNVITAWPEELPELTQNLIDEIENEYYKATAHIELRRRKYASIRDQLDMQYNDLMNGTTTWKDHVTKVKTDNPKRR